MSQRGRAAAAKSPKSAAPFRLTRSPTRMATFRSGVGRYMPW